MARTFLALQDVSVQLGGIQVIKNVNYTINEGEQWAVLGPSGSGKTVLAHTLCGLHFHSGDIRYGPSGKPRIAIVDQQHKFKNRQGMTDLYYQQRFNSSDADQTMTVAQELGTGSDKVPPGDPLHILPLLNRPLIQLSNGENKRVQLALALQGSPDLLILDNPFLGLDVDTRKVLHNMINNLAASGIHIILITGPGELPDAITHIARLEKGILTHKGPKSTYQPPSDDQAKTNTINLDETILKSIQSLTPENATTFDIAVKMKDVTITYGEKTLLDHINWEVRKGDRWNVSGPNGAGKSTILSLITGDNPQAYANEIYLFDRRRGSGESIWDIKKKIGFVSPELHLYFDFSATGFDVIASGIFDTIGLFRQVSEEQRELVNNWMKLLSLEDLRTRRLAQLSTGQQRMILLARALIKNPPMLILDEPCQGLDEAHTTYFRDLIGELTTRFDKTLIYVSHYKQELPACIDKYLRLDNGRQVN